MRQSFLTLLLVTLVVTRGRAQELVSPANGTNSEVLQIQARLASLLAADAPTNKASVALGKKFEASGPIVSGFGAKKILDVPRRILSFINPFARTEHTESLEKTAGVNPSAWTTTVGLHPGGSAFADATTHESSMTLVTVGRRSD